MTFTFEICSPKYGSFTVIAPLRFKAEIEARNWHVIRNQCRAKGRAFEVSTNTWTVDGRRTVVSLHRFVWNLMGRAPVRAIDHRDGQPLNNAEDNLRDGTGRNSRKIRRRRDNTTGVIGVGRKGRKWQARIQVDGASVQLGYFDTLEDARAVRDDAAKRLHGDFAVLNGPSN